MVAQADSPTTIDLHDNTLGNHQITISRSAVPTVGSMTVSGIPPQGTDEQSISGTIDLTVTTIVPVTFIGRFNSLTFTTTGLDADKTIDIEIASW